MTTAELEKLIGMKASVALRRELEGIVLGVKILETRQAYGREELRVAPLVGDGSAWVVVDRINVRAS